MEITNLKYKYKNTKEEAINDISFTIEEGKINCIIGKNGSGKTTLLELLAGLRIPTSGNIKIKKFEINNETKQVENKFLFEVAYNENIDITSNETIEEYFILKLKLFNYNNSKIKQRIYNALTMLELDDSCLNKNLSDLTSGELIRIKIANSLLLNPNVILFDNPTTGLDEQGVKTLIKILKTLKRRYNKTILIASNDIEFVHKLADNIIVLNNGKIVLSGNKYDVFKQEDKLKSYNIKVPKIISFSNTVLKEKNIKIGYRDEINDLIKDIYRFVK